MVKSESSRFHHHALKTQPGADSVPVDPCSYGGGYGGPPLQQMPQQMGYGGPPPQYGGGYSNPPPPQQGYDSGYVPQNYNQQMPHPQPNHQSSVRFPSKLEHVR